VLATLSNNELGLIITFKILNNYYIIGREKEKKSIIYYRNSSKNVGNGSQ
jgi:hypothetical protein